MTTYRITYMVDPGDGIESTVDKETDNDDMGDVLSAWIAYNDYFVTKCEVIDHSLMVK